MRTQQVSHYYLFLNENKRLSYFSADELLITELIFNGTFCNLSPAQSAAMLSVFVCDEKGNEMPKLSEELSGTLRTIQVKQGNIKKRWLSIMIF